MAMHDRADGSVSPGRLNRRTLLRGIAATGATTALGALLAACGSGGATATPKPAATTGAGGTAAPAATTGSAPSAASGGTTATQASSAGAPKKGGAIKAELDSDIANLDPMPSSLL